MNCPACQHALREIRYEGILIHTCTQCSGEWVAAAELRHIVQAREKRFTVEECKALLAVQPVRPVPRGAVGGVRRCPQCNLDMEAYTYAGDTGITLDRCQRCRGIWLDADELENVQRVYEGWEARWGDLPEDLAKHGPRIRQIAQDLKLDSQVRISRFPFVNAAINRVIDVLEDRGLV